MKRLFIIIAVLAVLLSCSQGKEQQQSQTEPEEEQEVKTSQSFNSVYNLRTYALEEGEEGQARLEQTTIQLDLGEPITVYDETREQDETTFRKIEDEEGELLWANDRYIVPEAQLGVVVAEEAFLYSEPKLDALTERIVAPTTIVAIHEGESENGFFKVTGWDEVNGFPFSGMYMEKAVISDTEADYRSAIFLFKASKMSNPKVKQKLLENALTFDSQVFEERIREALEAAATPGEDPAAEQNTGSRRQTEAFSAEAVTNDENINVREFPNEQYDNIVGQIGRGEALTITRRTAEEYTIGGNTARWYKISDPEGWIFGQFVDLSE
jgi:hypothetical protein